MTRAPRPRITSVRRSRPGKVTAGDTAEVRLDPGLLALLETPLGAGFHAPYNVPVMLASTAAVAVLAPASPGIDWTGRDLEVEWSAAPGPQDPVLAEARLEQFTERLARFTISGRTAAQPLYRGTLRMMALRAGVPVGFRSLDEYNAVRFRLSEARRPPAAPQPLSLASAPPSIPLGATAAVEVQLSNLTPEPLSCTAAAHLPYGAGLSLDSPAEQTVALAPGDSLRVSFHVRADRPHEVNLGRPWELTITAAGDTLGIPIQVPDPEPGRTFYLLTEDCETFDGGPLTGDYTAIHDLGNHNNFMDPEDYRVQMIRKPERMNQIAERHGARWTHFYAATQRFAAEWAARQSSTGEWDRVAAEMDASVRAGSRHHEYCPHIHFDYEPDSALAPQPRLVYDPATDGILPTDYYHPQTNPTHRYHDWDGAARGHSYIKELGDWTTLDTKAGSLRKTVQHLARLQANRRAPLVARTGSFDFGHAPEDQVVSTQAFLANGLRGNSDAYRPGRPPSPAGQMFWCTGWDRQEPIASLADTYLVQFAITMDTWMKSAGEMNHWFAAERESTRGPGVHAILFMTHAMFFAGEPDRFRSLEGGAFTQLDRHLAWVREHHPDIEFATATEALLEYLDYYTPTLDTYTEPLLRGGNPANGCYEFHVRLLGRGIRVDEQHPATVTVAAPPCFAPADILGMRVIADGETLATETDFDPSRQPTLGLTLTSRAPLRLEILLRGEAPWFQDRTFYDPPEDPQPDLFRIREPIDILRLLMNPIAGHPEPLGRRTHPLGGFSLAAALTAAQTSTPARLKLRWHHPPDLQSKTFTTESTPAAIQIRDDRGRLIAEAEVQPGPSPAPAPDPGQPAFQSALALYRTQRAWKLMLLTRKLYHVLNHGTWKQKLALLTHPTADLQSYELQFPGEQSEPHNPGPWPPAPGPWPPAPGPPR